METKKCGSFTPESKPGVIEEIDEFYIKKELDLSEQETLIVKRIDTFYLMKVE